MDLNALRKMARKQRETEEAEDNIAPEATVKRVVPAEEPTADTEIYGNTAQLTPHCHKKSDIL